MKNKEQRRMNRYRDKDMEKRRVIKKYMARKRNEDREKK